MFKPRPSFFDVCIAGFLYMPWMRNNWESSVFFVLYSVFLVILSIFLKPKREYRSLPLMLFVLWSFLEIFIHSFIVCPGSRTLFYFNYYLMVEGFLYVLCGVLFIRTVVIYSTNIRFIYILLPIAAIPWYGGFLRMGSLTPVAALGVAIVIYLFLSKRFKAGLICSISGLVAVGLNWPWVCMKFACRPKVWSQLLINTFYHPLKRMVTNEIIDPGIELSPVLERLLRAKIEAFESVKPWFASIFGTGFSQWTNNNYVWVDKDLYGWLYRHSDYGAIANDLGPIALILILWWVVESFKKIGIQPALILAITVALVCGFQVTMYLPFKAGIYLMMIALAIWEGVKRREIE